MRLAALQLPVRKLPHVRPAAASGSLRQQELFPTTHDHGRLVHLDDFRRTRGPRYLVLEAALPCLAQVGKWTRVAARCRRADQGAQLHQGLVEVADVTVRQQLLRRLPQPALAVAAAWIGSLGKQPTQESKAIGL